jgi:hypothetical protein
LSNPGELRWAIIEGIVIAAVDELSQPLRENVEGRFVVESLKKTGMQALWTFSNFPPFSATFFPLPWSSTNKPGRNF